MRVAWNFWTAANASATVVVGGSDSIKNLIESRMISASAGSNRDGEKRRWPLNVLLCSFSTAHERSAKLHAPTTSGS